LLNQEDEDVNSSSSCIIRKLSHFKCKIELTKHIISTFDLFTQQSHCIAEPSDTVMASIIYEIPVALAVGNTIDVLNVEATGNTLIYIGDKTLTNYRIIISNNEL